MLQNARVAALTVSKLLRENEQEGKDFIVTKFVKKINFEGAWGNLKAKNRF